MKRSLTTLKLFTLLNLILLAAYVSYNEYQKQEQSQQKEAEGVCQVLAVDTEKNLLAVKCVKH